MNEAAGDSSDTQLSSSSDEEEVVVRRFSLREECDSGFTLGIQERQVAHGRDAYQGGIRAAKDNEHRTHQWVQVVAIANSSKENDA